MMLSKFQSRYNLRLHIEEALSIAMAVIYNFMIIVYADISNAYDLFLINLFLILVILVMYKIHKFYNRRWFIYLRDWYIILILLAIYMESNKLVPLVNPHDLDAFIIQIDRVLFMGNDPTVLLERFHHPLLTELLQIVYASFYFLPFAFCILIYVKGKKSDFHLVAATIIMGFYLSFIGYYISPAIGPRYTMAHLQTIPLKGVLTFEPVRYCIDAIEGVTRDCCPSGHTLVAILTALLAYRYYRPFLPLAIIWTILLILSTVYLRYHYVLDLIAGFVLSLFVYRYGPPLAKRYLLGGELKPEKVRGDDVQTSIS